MTEKERWEPGTKVCVIGYGTATLYHDHTAVTRYTPKGLMVLKNKLRFRPGGAVKDWDSIPYEPYGGYYVDTKCQRKSVKSS